MERSTRQRTAIRNILENASGPLGPQQVFDLAKPHAPSLGIATVYRNLNSLVKEGVIVPVEIPGGAPRYETAGKSHHHHFYCRTCGEAFEVNGCHLTDVKTPRGFQIEGHHLVLHGVCKDCNKKKK